ncbi:squalene--hopene cyclase [Pseudomonas agarici]|uniref:squalene--hopene cyclase n=1 Tax=Pseudomonas agarici TaxID=46677 RepID=UPI0002E1936B|nr:squalene--hopene cyclase [Pseudomonas agarici]NWC08464.1 squalene--hopene cyclase [Pseudomonas agarici]SEK67718.1 squalene-hopene/tetraprenyl-beta-curcumene cyclase [Pseudomonas agarici]
MHNQPFPRDNLSIAVGQSSGATSNADLTEAVDRATDALLARQLPEGHWHYPLESDVATTAHYLLAARYLGEAIECEVEVKIAGYLRARQLPEGGWPLDADGPINVSSSVLAYFALKLLGDAPDAPHMRRACTAIRAHGGAESSNVFARFMLALFGLVPWRALPTMPVILLLAPRWFPFHLAKMASWARLVLVPLLVISNQRPLAKNLQNTGLEELFIHLPSRLGLPPRAPHQQPARFACLWAVDRLLGLFDKAWPKRLKQRAIDTALTFVGERLNGESGLGGLHVATMLASLMYETVGFPFEHPMRVMARQASNKLLVIEEEQAYCQPSESPLWDTAWALHALLETQTLRGCSAALQGAQWLRTLQILEVHGDWAQQAPDLPPGGWAFQYRNERYPDVDDSAVVAAALHRASRLNADKAGLEATRRACRWVAGLQSHNGGWGAYDRDNTAEYLNDLPFADHAAMTDAPTADVTSRCLSLLAPFQQDAEEARVVRDAVDCLWAMQESDGSWLGHWGVTYIYGTWSALCALDTAGVDHQDPRMQRAARWLVSIQNQDGGWGESAGAHEVSDVGHYRAASTASQTAWAMLGLMAAGAVGHPAVSRGADYLIATQRDQGGWAESGFTGAAVQKVMYLRYHGYSEYFPLWALARYRNLIP